MIKSEAEFETTRAYVDRLQHILMGLRRTHTPEQSFLKELAKSQREIAAFLATPAFPPE